MIKVKKPNGTIMEVNETSLKHALSLGFEVVKETKEKAKTRGGNSKNASK